MNMIGSLLSKELLSFNDKLDIIWLPLLDNKKFIRFFDSLQHNILDINDLYYGNFIPNMIVCNNKVFQYEQALSLSVRFHIPILVIDHTTKSPMLDTEKVRILEDLPCSYSIAINKNIYDSWNKYHNQILVYDETPQSIETWNTLLHNIAKRLFIL
jgi:hypothetical protein